MLSQKPVTTAPYPEALLEGWHMARTCDKGLHHIRGLGSEGVGLGL